MSHDENTTIPDVILDEKYQLHATAARLSVERLQAAGVAGDVQAVQFSAAGAVRHYNGCLELLEARLREIDKDAGAGVTIIGGGSDA